jgi:hypothetical protein
MSKSFTLVPFYKNVLNWNKFAGNEVTNKNLVGLYVNLVKEELSEIFHAVEVDDVVEYIDGLVDSLVVGSYLYALKKQENFNEYLESFETVDSLKSSIDKLESIYNSEQIENEISVVMIFLENVAFTINGNVDIIGACDEVMYSNWSKFPMVTEVNPEDEIKYIESQGRYSGITYKKSLDATNVERFIFYSDKGKIVKPSTFKEPRLSQFINKEWSPF